MRSGGVPLAASEAHAHVLDVRDDLVEQFGDMVVVQLVDNRAAVAPADYMLRRTTLPVIAEVRGNSGATPPAKALEEARL